MFSPHTSWDAVQGGVNDWLGNAFDLASSIPILQNTENASVGAGRFCNLKNAISVVEAIKRIKLQISLPYIRLALANHKSKGEFVVRTECTFKKPDILEDLITSIAFCAGSGSSVLKGVQADLYLTGEMLHQDILDAAQRGIHVILCNHSDSERGFLKLFRNKLQENLLGNQVKVIVSEIDCDPLKTV